MQLDSLFQNETTQEASNALKKYLKYPCVIEVAQLGQPSESNDIITIAPLTILTLNKFTAVVRKYCPDDYGNVSELLTGNAMFAFTQAVTEFILNTKAQASVTNGFILSGLLLHNGEPMRLMMFRQSILGEQDEDEKGNWPKFDNAHEIYDQIMQYFLWSYCFFLRSNYTVIGYIQLYNLTLQQLILKGQQENEILSITQRAEALEQLQQSMTEQSTEVQQPSKDSKPKQKTKRHVK